MGLTYTSLASSLLIWSGKDGTEIRQYRKKWGGAHLVRDSEIENGGSVVMISRH
jgi:hypothetical protein